MIAVLDRGFVYVGDVEYNEKGCFIRNPRNLRGWGTDKGLGHLALSGPTKNTVLDKITDIYVPLHGVMHLIDTKKELWVD
jgi:hypothetical protein